jgi:hypothetical protein
MQVRYSALSIGLSLAHVQSSRGVKYSLRRAVIGIPVCAVPKATNIMFYNPMFGSVLA